MIRLLIDEQLSPILVAKLAKREVFAQHVAHIGLAGVTDPDLWRYAFAHELSVVTMNARDFMHLAESADLHAGLIVLRESGLSREEQWERLAPVIDHLLETRLDLVNQVIEVWAAGSLPRGLSPRAKTVDAACMMPSSYRLERGAGRLERAYGPV